MVELGQLEKQYLEFAKRDVRVVVISNDDQETAQATQADFPHLVVVADTEQKMAKAVQVIHEGAGPMMSDTNSPTTFLLDGNGKVLWLFRPDRFMIRLSPQQLLEAIDQNLPKKQ
jgi:peroxiredoxin